MKDPYSNRSSNILSIWDHPVYIRHIICAFGNNYNNLIMTWNTDSTLNIKNEITQLTMYLLTQFVLNNNNNHENDDNKIYCTQFIKMP